MMSAESRSIFDLLDKDKAEEKTKKKKKQKKGKKKKSSGGGGGFKSLRTRNDYLLQEVTSAMIKELRRGNAINAMFWAEEMEKSGFGAYMWRRLQIFCSEDIGVVNNSLLPLVISAQEAWEQNKKSPSRQQFIGHAVLALVESPKNREVDDFLVTFRLKYKEEDWRPDIPDYALDPHTTKGKQMGRGDEHLIREGMKVDPQGASKSKWLEFRKDMLRKYKDVDWDEIVESDDE